MNYLPFLLLLLFCQGAQAQSKPFQFGFFAGPNLSNTLQTNNNGGPVFGDWENNKLGYGVSVFAEHYIHSRIAVRMGIGYANTGSRISKRMLVFAMPEPNMPEAVQFNFVVTDFFTPMHLRFNLNKAKCKWFLVGGFSPTFKVARKTVTKLWYADSHKERRSVTDNITEFRDMNVNTVAGFGCDFRLGQKIHVIIQPTFDLNLWGITRQASLNQRGLAAGLNIGALL